MLWILTKIRNRPFSLFFILFILFSYRVDYIFQKEKKN